MEIKPAEILFKSLNTNGDSVIDFQDNIDEQIKQALGITEGGKSYTAQDIEANYTEINTLLENAKNKSQNLGNKQAFGITPQNKGETTQKTKKEEMEEFFGNGSIYVEHSIDKNIGSLRMKGENVIIIKMEDGTYQTIRQAKEPKTKDSENYQELEYKTYGSLEELRTDMLNEEYGWGRQSWQINKGYSTDSPKGKFSLMSLRFEDY